MAKRHPRFTVRSVSATPTLRALDEPMFPFKMTYPVIMGPGDLTASGLLYEGSVFAEWEARVFATMRAKLFDCISTKEEPTKKDFDQEWTAQVILIETLVSNALLARIPRKDLYNRPTLLKYLAGLATPFRLMELPQVVRWSIFKFALPKKFKIGALHDESIVPALLQVSSLVRKETLPLFYSNTTFEIDRKLLAARPEIVKSWASRIENTSHVRSVKLCGRNSIELCYSDAKGLTVDMQAEKREEHVGAIEAKVCGVEQDRALLKLMGEGIFLALWTDVHVWEESRFGKMPLNGGGFGE